MIKIVTDDGRIVYLSPPDVIMIEQAIVGSSRYLLHLVSGINITVTEESVTQLLDLCCVDVDSEDDDEDLYDPTWDIE